MLESGNGWGVMGEYGKTGVLIRWSLAVKVPGGTQRHIGVLNNSVQVPAEDTVTGMNNSIAGTIVNVLRERNQIPGMRG